MSYQDAGRAVFIEEAQELLAELEAALLELEESPEDRALVDRVFRTMHTIKGSGAMFGFDDIATFTHDVETVFDRVRNGEVAVCKTLLDLTLAARDHIQYLLDCATQGEEPDTARADHVLAGLRRFLDKDETAEAQQKPEETAPAVVPDDSAKTCRTYRVRFKPVATIFASGSNPLFLLDELGEIGQAVFMANMDDVPPLDSYDAESCYAWWDVILNTEAEENSIRDVFIFVEDDCTLDVQVIDNPEVHEDDASYKKIGEILVERGDVHPEDLHRALEAQPRLGEILKNAGVVGESQVKSALVEQSVVREVRNARHGKEAEAASSIRVAAEKLDYLVDLVGELVIVQAQISQVVSERGDAVLTGLSEELERLSNELRDSTLGIRMLPIGTTFNRFRRLVRDLSSELGKEIDLVTQGAETELDKTVIERLSDPLVHLLRNAIDHGIEPPEVRKAAGKPERGTIVLAAEQAGGDVIIRIIDDGKGMNPATILAKAVERGLVSQDNDLSRQEILGLIFAPGFSTVDHVTSVSGRGVGMDVVKRSIDYLRGMIDIQSEVGQGSTISIKLPLTLAIIDGLQVRVGEEYFVMPLSVVEECVEISRASTEKGSGQSIINLRGEIVPYIRLREWFDVAGVPPENEQVVITGVDGGRIGIVVDNVIGEHQTVIKSLGRVYKDVQGISGATIKGDGTMALILDVAGLYRSVMAENRQRH